jgi:hypothetical protein
MIASLRKLGFAALFGVATFLYGCIITNATWIALSVGGLG